MTLIKSRGAGIYVFPCTTLTENAYHFLVLLHNLGVVTCMMYMYIYDGNFLCLVHNIVQVY